MDMIEGERLMRKSSFLIGCCLILVAGSGFGATKLSDFKEKARDEIERTRPAVESAAFKEVQDSFKERRIAMRFLTDGAYTGKFVNARDKKEYFLTAVPVVSHFPTAAPPLAVLMMSDGKEVRAGWMQTGQDRRGRPACSLLTTGGELIARADSIQALKKPPLPVPRGEAAIAIAKNPEEDDVILVLVRSPYVAEKEEEMECTALVFYSGDLGWEKFAGSDKEQGE